MAWDSPAARLPSVAGITGALLVAAVCGVAVSIGDTTAALLCVALVACIFILLDFRVGVVLLVVLMPLSASALFPHQIAGIKGLNPLNALLVATLGSYLLRAVADGSLRRFLPGRLFWLYLVPIVIAGVLGSQHVGEIPLSLYASEQVSFDNATGYLRDIVFKPVLLVVFALLVAAAVRQSRDPAKFVIPTIASIWMMALLVLGFVIASGASLDELSSAGARGFLSPLGVHANELGCLYALAYALLLFTWAATRERVLKLALVASMLLIVAALVLTFSRGAFLAFLVVNVLFVLTRRHAYGWILGGLLLGALMLALPGAVYDRLSVGFDGDRSALSAGRIDDIWLPLLPEVWRSPLIGNGLSSILWSDAMRSGSILQVASAHNAYLDALLDLGFVGLALLLTFFGLLLQEFRRAAADPKLDPTLRGFLSGGAAGLIGFFVAALTGTHLTPCPEQSFLWLAVGVLYGLRSRSSGVSGPGRALRSGSRQ